MPLPLDIVISALLLIALAPILLIVGLLVRLTSPGPALHRGLRVGRGGQVFHLYKFRSMRSDAAQAGPGITAADDQRITPLGRLLRRTKLDELPQLINVLKGEMSLVGPRPEDPRYVARYTPEQRRVLAVRPGITSPASVRYRGEEQLLTGPDWEAFYVNQVMPDKLAIELAYLERRSTPEDLKVLWQTALALLR